MYLNWTGTHKGVFQGIPPTDKSITIRSADLYRVENGKIGTLGCSGLLEFATAASGLTIMFEDSCYTKILVAG